MEWNHKFLQYPGAVPGARPPGHALGLCPAGVGRGPSDPRPQPRRRVHHHGEEHPGHLADAQVRR